MLALMCNMSLVKVVTHQELHDINVTLEEGQINLPETMKIVK